MRAITSLIVILLSINCFSQNFKGTVIDKKSFIVPGATIYIKEANRGLLCDGEGCFQTTLSVGSYTIITSCLGYGTDERTIEIKKGESTDVLIRLAVQPIELSEVVVANKEDPAYEIMRKAIAKAPYFSKQVEYYKAKSYIKGNIELLKISGLIDNLSKKGTGIRFSELKNQLFIQESFNEIEFKAPHQYKQTVKAFNSNIPDDFNSNDAMRIMHSSLYDPVFAGLISPLNKKAFSYYNFRYEGFIEESGQIINKIAVLPKLNDPMLLIGYLYIADNTWHIYSAELICDVMGVKETFRVTYQSIEGKAYLPITYQNSTDLNVMGVQAQLKYYASISYDSITVNTEANFVDNQILEKKVKRNFEIKKDSTYVVKSDSLAGKRDKLYWESIRATPIDSLETASLLKRDSIQQRVDSIRKKNDKSHFSIGSLISGGSIGSDSSQINLHYEGLLQAIPEYNFVDGLWIGQKVTLNVKLKKNNKLSISPYGYYATARKRGIVGASVSLDYAPMRFGNIELNGGTKSEDFNPEGIHRVNNFMSSLIKGKNYDYFYQKDFIGITNKIEITNGLHLITGFEIAKRYGLRNHTDYTWGSRKKITPNPFDGQRFDRTSFNIQFIYMPYVYYSVNNGKKEYQKLESPLFSIRYEEGFSSWQTNNSKYRKFEAGIKQSIRTSYFSRLEYQLAGGSFIGNKDKLHFTDWQHFNTGNTWVSFKNIVESYVLLGNYEASTNRYWVRSRVLYTDKYILLKRIPFLQGKMFTENLHLNNLYTPDMKMYTEIGYSVDVMNFISLGVFNSFQNFKHQAVGIRFSMNLFSPLKFKW